ncbi:MAG: SDR family oxidoreductase [Betaproteobacteria bacterium]
MSARKTALVTGSTSGIGLGIATTLASGGTNVILNGFGDAAQIEKLRAKLAADHAVQVSEVAEIAAFLVRNDAASITGAVIPIDGGWTAQ